MLANIIVAWITVFALAITIISAFSYRRSKSRKVLFVTCAFGLFFLKGLILSVGLLQTQIDWKSLTIYGLILDTIILILLFAAIILRKKKTE